LKEFIHLFCFNRAPHWSVNMGYKFFKIDSWDNEIAYLKVDMKTVFSQNYEFEGT